MSHDFEPTEAEKEMLSHIKDIEVNRKQSELGNIISGAILDGQNQIHDLYKEKATAQEVEYRMRRSYTYWMNKLHQQLQKAREEEYARGWADGAAGVITEHQFMSVDDAEKMLREKGYKHLANALHLSELDQAQTLENIESLLEN